MGKKKLFAFADPDLKKTGFDEEKETAANWIIMYSKLIFFGIKVIFFHPSDYKLANLPWRIDC